MKWSFVYVRRTIDEVITWKERDNEKQRSVYFRRTKNFFLLLGNYQRSTFFVQCFYCIVCTVSDIKLAEKNQLLLSIKKIKQQLPK